MKETKCIRTNILLLPKITDSPTRDNSSLTFHSNDAATGSGSISSSSLALLQHSLSSMDLNVSPTSAMPLTAHQTRSTSILPASTQRSPAATKKVPQHRHTLRQRASSTSAAGSSGGGGDAIGPNAPVTNRRTISRPRKHLSGGNSSAGSSAILAYSLAENTGGSASTEVDGGGGGATPTAKQVTRFYLNANKSARVKPTCLETIQEMGDEDTTPGVAGGSVLLGEHCNFLSVRKLRRSLTFTASAALAENGARRCQQAAIKQLVMRRRRRIKEKLGRKGARTATKFSMQVFMERMRALHAEEEADDEGTGAKATVPPPPVEKTPACM